MFLFHTLISCDATDILDLSHLTVEVSKSHTDTPYQYDSSRRGIRPSQRPLPDNTHNIHNWQIPMQPAGFKLAIPASELPQTHALNRAAFDLRTFTSVNYTNIPRTQRVFVHSLLQSHKAVKQKDIPALCRVISSLSYFSLQRTLFVFLP